MKKSIALAIAAIGIGLTTNVFANAAGTQVSPSTINLSADGITVTIHTQIDNSDCPTDPEDGKGFDVSVTVENTADNTFSSPEELSVGVDGQGHLVITIGDDITSYLEAGEAIFTVSAVCSYDSTRTDEGVDTAKIIDNTRV